MKQFSHPDILPGFYICPGYMKCRESGLKKPCSHGFIHYPIINDICKRDTAIYMGNLDGQTCSVKGTIICELEYCREATTEDEENIKKWSKEHLG